MLRTVIIAGVVCWWLSPLYASWAQETFSTLSLEQKIGQLIIVAAVSDPGEINTQFMVHEPYHMDPEYVRTLITDYQIGGVIFLGAGYIQRQIELTREFQSLSTLPLLVAQDCEWGLAMRLLDAVRYPRALTLGTLPDPSLIYDLGKEVGMQMGALGVHINLAPVADVNTNPDNPVIKSRAFDSTPDDVAQKALLFARGLQDAGILACAKHFPGHGDTATDSHHTLPYIAHSRERLHTVELAPFAYLIDHGIACVMTAHIAVPALTGTAQTPATVSRAVVTDLLRTTLGFQGLIITDGLGMRALTDHYTPGELEVAALTAGNDILLCPVDVPRAIAAIKQAVLDGRICQQELDEHVMRVLRIKEQLMHTMPESFTPVYDHSRFHSPAAYELQRTLFSTARVLAKEDAQYYGAH